MPPGSNNKLSKVEELKSKLFSRNFEVKIEHRDVFSSHDNEQVMDSWNMKNNSTNSKQEFFMQTSLFKKFFIYSLFFFFIALAYGSYMIFFGGNTVSNNNIDISILGNTFTAGGEDLSLQIGITNKNTLALNLVDLVVEYPKSSSGDLTGEVERIRESLGTIDSGAVRNENVKVVLFGEQGSVRPIRVSIEYRVEGSNAIFVKDKLYEVNINSTPIDLTVDAPNDISPNQELTLKIKSTLNATKTAQSLLTRVDYPLGFKFISATPEPTFGNNVWSMGDIAPGGERNISITGKMIDVFDGEEKVFKVWTGSQSKTDKTAVDIVFNSLGHIVTIKKPFIEAGFYLNGVKQREYSIDSRAGMTGEIRWSNNLDTSVNNMKITASLSGSALDRKSIRPEQGFYDSASDTIVWDRNSLKDFAEVSPGDSGSVAFSFKPLSAFSTNGIISNPVINVDVSIAGQQEISGYDNKELKNTDSVLIKIVSDAGFANKVLYYSGPFTNTGPIPPKVEKTTKYTVVWSLSNSANDIVKGVVQSSLPTWVDFVGLVSPLSEDLTYNDTTREITWNVGNLNKGVGITSKSREVSFQIALSPSLSQRKTIPVLINEAVLTGVDGFANVGIRVVRGALNTNLVNDPMFPANGATVAE